MSEDPIGFSGGPHYYVYADDNPVGYVDLLGLCRTNPQSHVCLGRARVLQGNPRLIGRVGGIPPNMVAADSAAAMPQQFGVNTGVALSPYSGHIYGIVARGRATFNQVTDVIGGPPINGENRRDRLQRLNPDTLIIELPSVPRDMGTTSVLIVVPNALSCPTGTVELAGPGPS